MGKDFKTPWKGLGRSPTFLSNLLGGVRVGLVLAAGWYLIQLLVEGNTMRSEAPYQ